MNIGNSAKFLMTLGTLMMALAGPAGATLLDIGTASYGGNSYNLIYDNSSPMGSIVYLDYSKSYDNWSNQVAWANNLNTAGVVTYNLNAGYGMNWSGSWRLPSTTNDLYVFGTNGTTTAGYNMTNSELAYLFYIELGNKGYVDKNGNLQGGQGYGLSHTGPFANILAGYYWLGTAFGNDPNNHTYAWDFVLQSGRQDIDYTGNTFLGLAVRPGELLEMTAPVPEPSTTLLLAIGLAGLAVVVSYRRRGC